jgi:hypothetical protein
MSISPSAGDVTLPTPGLPDPPPVGIRRAGWLLAAQFIVLISLLSLLIS